jgi:uncharacterized protein (TIGR00251 family)
LSGVASWDGDDLVVRVRVQPRSSRSEILGVVDSQLRIRTTAAPADGKANRAVIRLLADYFELAPSRIRLTHGIAQRNKRFVVSGPLVVPADLPVATRGSNSL